MDTGGNESVDARKAITIPERIAAVDRLKADDHVRAIPDLAYLDRRAPGWLTVFLFGALGFILAILLLSIESYGVYLLVPAVITQLLSFIEVTHPNIDYELFRRWILLCLALWLYVGFETVYRSSRVRKLLTSYILWPERDCRSRILRVPLRTILIINQGSMLILMGLFVLLTLFPIVYLFIDLILLSNTWWQENQWLPVIVLEYWKLSLALLSTMCLFVFFVSRKLSRETTLRIFYIGLCTLGYLVIGFRISVDSNIFRNIEITFGLLRNGLNDVWIFFGILIGLGLIYPMGLAMRLSRILWLPFVVFRNVLYWFTKRLILRWNLLQALIFHYQRNNNQISGNGWSAICKDHRIRLERQEVRLSYRLNLSYYCCPLCKSDTNIYTGIACLALTLDERMDQDIENTDQILYINGLHWLSDQNNQPVPIFETVLIGQIKDHDIEEFITVYQNKTLTRYHTPLEKMSCEIETGVVIGQNIQRILGNAFLSVYNDFDTRSNKGLYSRFSHHINEQQTSPRELIFRTFGGAGISCGLLILLGVVFGLLVMSKYPNGVVVAVGAERTSTPTVRSKKTVRTSGTPIITKTPTVTRKAPPQSLDRIVSDIDKAVLILVPAGDFKMGNDRGLENENTLNEYPAHEVSLDAFYIDQYEVTIAQYKMCIKANACNPPQSIKSQKSAIYFEDPAFSQHPVIKVSWEDASAYCKWVQRRLPTEAEWERAAGFNPQKGVIHQYPWGNAEPDNLMANFGRLVGDTSVVGSYEDGQSSLGLMDMSGNVWEWVFDWYSDQYYSESPRENPIGPQDGFYRVLRGGSWNSPSYDITTTARLRYAPQEARYDAGFRCVKSLNP